MRRPPPADRYFLVGNCKFVDEVLCDAPLVITKELLEDNNIDVVVTATERGEPSVDKYVWCCAYGVCCAYVVLCCAACCAVLRAVLRAVLFRKAGM